MWASRPVEAPKPVARMTTTVVTAPATPPKPVLTTAQAPVVKPAGAIPSLFLTAQDRIVIFVDGANMDGACRDAVYQLDSYKVGDFLRG